MRSRVRVRVRVRTRTRCGVCGRYEPKVSLAAGVRRFLQWYSAYYHIDLPSAMDPSRHELAELQRQYDLGGGGVPSAQRDMHDTDRRVQMLPSDVECAYALVPSRKWFLGLVTLVSSLTRYSDEVDAKCSYLFLESPLLPDSQLTQEEHGFMDKLAKPRRIHWHTISAPRIQLWGSVPFIRDGGNMSFAKMELFYSKSRASIVFFDLDMLVINPLGFVHNFLRKEPRHLWSMHGSANFYGLSGWLFGAETTQMSMRLTGSYINAGWLAFNTPVPDSFLDAVEKRVETRLKHRVKTFSADQDVVNHALQALKARGIHMSQVHPDWYTNYRPRDVSLLKSWHAVHWMGVPKPWGSTGHTIAPVRFNDQTIVVLDNLWRSECERAVSTISTTTPHRPPLGGRYLFDSCATQPKRHIPSRVADEAWWFIVLALVGLPCAAWVWWGAWWTERLPSTWVRGGLLAAALIWYINEAVKVADAGRRPERRRRLTGFQMKVATVDEDVLDTDSFFDVALGSAIGLLERFMAWN